MYLVGGRGRTVVSSALALPPLLQPDASTHSPPCTHNHPPTTQPSYSPIVKEGGVAGGDGDIRATACSVLAQHAPCAGLRDAIRAITITPILRQHHSRCQPHTKRARAGEGQASRAVSLCVAVAVESLHILLRAGVFCAVPYLHKNGQANGTSGGIR